MTELPTLATLDELEITLVKRTDGKTTKWVAQSRLLDGGIVSCFGKTPAKALKKVAKFMKNYDMGKEEETP